MKNFIGKLISMISASIGTTITGVIIYQIITDDIYVSTRLEGWLALTAIPMMYAGFNLLKSIWQREALSKVEDKEDYHYVVVTDEKSVA